MSARSERGLHLPLADIGAQHDDGHWGENWIKAQRCEHLGSVHVQHMKIEAYQVWPLRPCEIKAGLPSSGREQLERRRSTRATPSAASQWR